MSEPFWFVVLDNTTGEPIAAVPVEDDHWHEAMCWAYLASLQTKERS